MLTDERIIELWRDHGGVMGSAQDFARAIEREALEEAAWVCDRLAADMYDDGARPAAGAAWECAAAIRALADAPDAGAGDT